MKTVTVSVRNGRLVIDGAELPEDTVLNLVVADDDAIWALWCEEHGDVVVVEETLAAYLGLESAAPSDK